MILESEKALHDWQIVFWAVSGAFAAIATILSLHLILKHYKYWTVPSHQVLITRILIMVPLYAVASWASLLVWHYASYIDVVRDIYEAYVVFLFVKLILLFGGGEERLANDLVETGEPVKQLFPFNFCIGPSTTDARFIRRVKQGTLQFVILKPLLAIATVVLQALDLFGEEFLNFKRGKIYIFTLANLSSTAAVYFLVQFYLATRDLTADFSPGEKFIAVKLIVFLSFWQGVLISVLTAVGVIRPFGPFEVHDVAEGLQNFLICTEMCIIAWKHRKWFDYKVYKLAELKKFLPNRQLSDLKPYMRRAVASLSPVHNVREVYGDVRGTFGPNGGGNGNNRVLETFAFDKSSSEWRTLDPIQ